MLRVIRLPIAATLALMILGGSAVFSATPTYDFNFTTTVTATTGSTAPAAGSTFSVQIGNAPSKNDFQITFTGLNCTGIVNKLNANGATGTTIGFGTFALKGLPAPGASDVSYSVNVSYTYQITLADFSSGSGSGTAGPPVTVNGNITGNVIVGKTGSGSISCMLNHKLVSPTTSSTLPAISFDLSSGATVTYTLKVAAFELSTTQATFQYSTNSANAILGATVTANLTQGKSDRKDSPDGKKPKNHDQKSPKAENGKKKVPDSKPGAEKPE